MSNTQEHGLMLLAVPHLVLDHAHARLTNPDGRVVGEIRRGHVATSSDPDLSTQFTSPRPGRLTQFFGSDGEFAFAYQAYNVETWYSFEVRVWDREGRMVGRVDRRKQVWSDGTCSGRFRSRRTSDTGLAWRLVGASGETLVDLWPDRQRSYRPRASPMHLEFNEATELPLRMIAVAATQPLVTNISRICVA